MPEPPAIEGFEVDNIYNNVKTFGIRFVIDLLTGVWVYNFTPKLSELLNAWAIKAAALLVDNSLLQPLYRYAGCKNVIQNMAGMTSPLYPEQNLIMFMFWSNLLCAVLFCSTNRPRLIQMCKSLFCFQIFTIILFAAEWQENQSLDVQFIAYKRTTSNKYGWMCTYFACPSLLMMFLMLIYSTVSKRDIMSSMNIIDHVLDRVGLRAVGNVYFVLSLALIIFSQWSKWLIFIEHCKYLLEHNQQLHRVQDIAIKIYMVVAAVEGYWHIKIWGIPLPGNSLRFAFYLCIHVCRGDDSRVLSIVEDITGLFFTKAWQELKIHEEKDGWFLLLAVLVFVDVSVCICWTLHQNLTAEPVKQQTDTEGADLEAAPCEGQSRGMSPGRQVDNIARAARMKKAQNTDNLKKELEENIRKHPERGRIR